MADARAAEGEELGRIAIEAWERYQRETSLWKRDEGFLAVAIAVRDATLRRVVAEIRLRQSIAEAEAARCARGANGLAAGQHVASGGALESLACWIKRQLTTQPEDKPCRT